MLLLVFILYAPTPIFPSRVRLRRGPIDHLTQIPSNASWLEDFETRRHGYHNAFWERAMKGERAAQLASWVEGHKLLVNSEPLSISFSTTLACATVKCSEFVPDEDGDVFPEKYETAWSCVQSECWPKEMADQRLIKSMVELYMSYLDHYSTEAFVDILPDVDAAFTDLGHAQTRLTEAIGKDSFDQVDFGDAEISPEEFDETFVITDGSTLAIETALVRTQNATSALSQPQNTSNTLSSRACKALRETKIPLVVQILWRIVPIPVMVWLATAAMQCSLNPAPCVASFSSAVSTIFRTGLTLRQFASSMKYVLRVAHIKLEERWRVTTLNGKRLKALVMHTLNIQINLLDKIVFVVARGFDYWKRVLGRRSLERILHALGRIIAKYDKFVNPTALLSKVSCIISGKMFEETLKNKRLWTRIGQGIADIACSNALLDSKVSLLKTIGFPVAQFALTKFLCAGSLDLDFKPWEFIEDEDVLSLTGNVAAIQARIAAHKFVSDMDSYVWHD